MPKVTHIIEAGGENAIAVKPLFRPVGGKTYSSVLGCRMADDCYVHTGHSWLSLERGGRVKIGVDDFTLKVLGNPENLKIPRRGTLLHQGRAGWLFARGEHEANILAPVTGKIFDVNAGVLEQPQILSEDPYEKGWLIIVEPAAFANDLKRLLSGQQRLRWMERETERLLRLLGEDYERLAATGGEIISDLFGHFPEIGWDRLVKTFFSREGLEA